MENNKKTHYTVIGSAALHKEQQGLIIEFPTPEPLESLDPSDSIDIPTKAPGPLKYWFKGVLQGSLKGSPVRKDKQWESALGTACIFLFAIACIYFGV